MQDQSPLALAGRSAAVAAARAAFHAAAAGRGPVLVVAEAGCRAGELARALHARTRPGAPFAAIDCGADDPPGIERRLFGGPARYGAATDLETVTRDSAVVEAAAGTLFIEHIDQLSASTQRRLARVLRDAEVRVPRLRTPVLTSFRLVAATALDLDDEARGGRFRADLLRRLTACRIPIPPLRQRTSDIPDILGAMPLQGVAFTAGALTVLISLPWAGNIDELAEVVTRLASTGGSIQQEDVLMHLPLHRTLGRLDLTAGLREARRQFERDYIAAVLERHRWSMSEAARTLGIERANLYRKTRQLGITRGSRESWTAGH